MPTDDESMADTVKAMLSQHGVKPTPELPLIWLWDLYPLAESAWPNILGFDDGSGDGNIIDMRYWLSPYGLNDPPTYRPANALCRRVYTDGGVRRCYVPQAKDLELIHRLWPTIKDPGNPPWPCVEAELIAGGQPRDELAKMNTPTLLLLLEKAEHVADVEGHPESVKHLSFWQRNRDKLLVGAALLLLSAIGGAIGSVIKYFYFR